MDYNKTLNKYLKQNCANHYGEMHSKLTLKTYKTFIVIPCYAEHDYIFTTLDSINNQDTALLKSCLVVIVVNNSVLDSVEIKDNNKKTYELLKLKKYNFEFVMIDCYSKKHALRSNIAGVGMARKIGLDYCLMFAKNKKSLLCSLDADTQIHNNYLHHVTSFFNKNEVEASVINFKHQKSKDKIIEEGIRKYEFIIKNIAKEIDNTGSPYGYVSLGSTIICTLKAYIACGGMSKKKATEDFYFLQALAKHTPIKKIKNILVFPSSRNNQRVYLGTGFRMKEYKKNKEFKYLNYSKKSFKKLKNLISLVDASWNKEYNIFLSEIMKILDKKIIDFLIEKKIETVWNNIRKNSKNKNQFMHFFHQWFDALTIIQFLKKLNN